MEKKMKKMSFGIWIIGCLLLALSSGVFAQTINVIELKNFVNSGAQYIKKVGAETAYKEISNPKGKFVKNGKYLCVYDFKGKCLAHGGDPTLVGKNLASYKDKFGESVVNTLSSVAKSGEGFSGYYYPDSKTGTEEFKLAYVKKIDDTAFIGSGVFVK